MCVCERGEGGMMEREPNLEEYGLERYEKWFVKVVERRRRRERVARRAGSGDVFDYEKL